MMITPRTCSKLLTAFLLLLPAVKAEEWEIGGAVGYGYLLDANVTRDAATAKAGLEGSPSISVYASHREYRLFGGDFYYSYRPGDLKLSSGGTKVNFESLSHLIHYDVTIHPSRGEGRFQPYIGVGGGIRVVQGTGREAAFQPLNNFAVLSRTQEILPLLSVAVGARTKLSNHMAIRFEFRDNITPFPGRVIFANRLANPGKWWHDLTPQIGLGVTF